ALPQTRAGPERRRARERRGRSRERTRRGAGRPAVVGGSGLLGGHLLFLAPADAGLDETVEVAVEDRRGVVDLVAGAQILDHLVRVRDVGAHLVAPAGLDVAGELLLLRSLLLALEVEEAGLEDAHRGLAVLDLGLLVLHAHDHTGGDVGDAHGRVRRVHRLPARARGPV